MPTRPQPEFFYPPGAVGTQAVHPVRPLIPNFLRRREYRETGDTEGSMAGTGK